MAKNYHFFDTRRWSGRLTSQTILIENISFYLVYTNFITKIFVQKIGYISWAGTVKRILLNHTQIFHLFSTRWPTQLVSTHPEFRRKLRVIPIWFKAVKTSQKTFRPLFPLQTMLLLEEASGGRSQFTIQLKIGSSNSRHSSQRNVLSVITKPKSVRPRTECTCKDSSFSQANHTPSSILSKRASFMMDIMKLCRARLNRI